MPKPANEDEAIAARLNETSPLTALIEARCYLKAPPKNAARPYLVFYRTSGKDGARLAGDRGLKQSEVFIEAHADTAETAEAVLKAARDRLHCWQDRTNGVQGCFARPDADTNLDDDGEHTSGQTFGLSFAPQA